MKFKYIGRDDCFCIELVAYDIVSSEEYLKNGQIIDVPNKYERVIKSLDVSGLFQRVNDKKVTSKKVTEEKGDKK